MYNGFLGRVLCASRKSGYFDHFITWGPEKDDSRLCFVRQKWCFDAKNAFLK